MKTSTAETGISVSNEKRVRKQPAIWFPAIKAGTGADTFTTRLSEALRKRGYRAEVAWLPQRAEVFPYAVKPIEPPEWATIVHVNSWLHPRFIPANLPYVSTIHGCFHVEEAKIYTTFPQKLYHKFWIYPAENRNIALADAVSAVSKYTTEASIKIFGRKDITPILNWIDTDTFRPKGRPLPGTPFKLLYVGNISDRKGRRLLPEIMKLLGPEFELYYTGLPSEFNIKQQLPANMFSIGRIENVNTLVDYYQNTDALLFPTYLEGFGLTVAEAMATGLPVITTDFSSLPELVEHEKTGLLCPRGDTVAFVEMIKRLSIDTKLWRRLAKESRLSAECRFQEDRALNEYLHLYELVLSGP